MIGVAVALALQAMSQTDLIEEGERLGRMTAVMGACSTMGYTVDQDAGRRLANDFERRAVDAGYTEAVAAQSFKTGVDLEMIDLRTDTDTSEMSEAQLRQYAISTMGRIKRRCREVAMQEPTVITDLARGEQNADAQLAIMLRPLD